MTDTQRAIAAMYYRLVYEKKVMAVENVPTAFQPLLEEYRREVES